MYMQHENMLCLGLSKAVANTRRPVSSCCSLGAGNFTHQQENALCHFCRCLSFIALWMYCRKSRLKFFALWTAALLIWDRNCTNEQQFSVSKLYARMKAIFPVMGNLGITSDSF